MLWPLEACSQHATCKICAKQASVFGRLDVNRGGPPGAATRPSLGQDLVYFRCPHCGLIFTTQLDYWQTQEFARHIYNERYVDVDPDYLHDRPVANAQMLLGMLHSHPRPLRLLDFGAGSGLLAQHLRAHGIHADSEDPYSEAAFGQPAQSPSHAYDIVCAFEVIEHSAAPLQTLAQIKAHLKPGGVAIISTLLQPDDIAVLGCNWWYCAPRNGHISLFSKECLELALQKTGVEHWLSHSPGLHVAYF
jgi:SAM-dependent methyltransferase